MHCQQRSRCKSFHQLNQSISRSRHLAVPNIMQLRVLFTRLEKLAFLQSWRFRKEATDPPSRQTSYLRALSAYGILVQHSLTVFVRTLAQCASYAVCWLSSRVASYNVATKHTLLRRVTFHGHLSLCGDGPRRQRPGLRDLPAAWQTNLL